MNIKKVLIANLGVFFLTTIMVSAASISFTNQTGYNIHQMYLSPDAGSQQWSDNLLTCGDLLEDQTVKVNWDVENTKDWNIMVIDEHQRKFYWRHIDVSKAGRVTLKPEGIVQVE